MDRLTGNLRFGMDRLTGKDSNIERDVDCLPVLDGDHEANIFLAVLSCPGHAPKLLHKV